MPIGTNTETAPIAQAALHNDPNVQTILSFAMCEDIEGAWTLIDALIGLDCLTYEQAWSAISDRIVRDCE